MNKINQRLLLIYYFLKTRLRKFHSRQSLTDWQQKQLKKFARHVLRRSPYYANYASASLAAWPIINKKIHMENFNRINTLNLDADTALSIAIQSEQDRDFSPTYAGVSVGLSSGTSGNRGLFLSSDPERAEWAGTVFAKLLPLQFKRQRIAFFLRANNNLYQSLGSKLIQFRFFDLLIPLETHLKALQTYCPTILIAPAQVLVHLAQNLSAYPQICPKLIISVAEVLEPQDKQFIEQAFSAPVHQVYQCTEGFLACTCQYGELHLNEDIVYIEKDWIDKTQLRFVPIITDFRRSTQPIVRYRLDDILVENPEPCRCGSVFTRLARIEGRCDDLIKLANKNQSRTIIYPDFIRNALISCSKRLLDYQVIQTSIDRLQIKLTPLDDELQQLVAQTLQTLFAKLDIIQPQLSITKLEQQPLNRKTFGGKKRRVIGLPET